MTEYTPIYAGTVTRYVVVESFDITPADLALRAYEISQGVMIKETCFGIVINGNELDVDRVIAGIRMLDPDHIFVKDRGFPPGDPRRCRANLGGLTSSLASVFNSCWTLVTMDVYRKLRPSAAEKSLVRFGQLTTVALVGLGLAWIPFMKLVSGQIYQYLQSVQSYVAPPITAVFVLGLLWRRANSAGALAALAAGFAGGLARLVLELNRDRLAPGLVRDLVSTNFLHFAIVLFAACAAVHVAVSLLTPAPPDDRLRGLTVGGSGAAAVEPRGPHFALTATLSLLLLATVAGVWEYFR